MGSTTPALVSQNVPIELAAGVAEFLGGVGGCNGEGQNRGVARGNLYH